MLSQAQINHFDTQGFLVVEDLLGADVLKRIHAEYGAKMDLLYKDWASQGKVPAPTPEMSFWDKLENCSKGSFDWYQPFDISLPGNNITHETPFHFGPATFDMITNQRILDLVECLIGPEITSNPIQHVRIKPPQKAVPKREARAHIVKTDWHQDMGVTLESADNTKMVTIWLAITDATVENGCLQVVPGKRANLLPHCSQDGAQVAIRDRYLDGKALSTPVKAGGAVIFHPMTPHSSLANTSDGYRWSFDLRYNVTGQPTGRSHFPEFVARSKSNPENELRDWQNWRDLWEQARSQVAGAEHIAQHRWPTDGPYCA